MGDHAVARSYAYGLGRRLLIASRVLGLGILPPGREKPPSVASYRGGLRLSQGERRERSQGSERVGGKSDRLPPLSARTEEVYASSSPLSRSGAAGIRSRPISIRRRRV